MEIINLGNRVVNNYIFKNYDNKYILIDTGYENGFKNFLKKLKKSKINLSDIDYVFLTHAHDDHAGFLNELLQTNLNIKVIASKEGVYSLKKGQNSFLGGCSTRLALLFCKAMALFGNTLHKFPPINEKFFERFIFTEELEIEKKKEFEKILCGKIIETKGHTRCSVSLFLDNGVLFLGDAAMNGFPSLYKATIFIENLDEYYLSWQRIIELNPKCIYPSHGKKFCVNELKKNLPKLKNLKSYVLTE